MTIQPINSGSIYLLSKLFSNNEIKLKLLCGIDPYVYASGGGYNDKIISEPDSILSQDSKSIVQWPTQVFTLTGPLDNNRPIIGYHITYDDVIIGECIFDHTITPVGNGGSLSIRVNYLLNNTLG